MGSEKDGKCEIGGADGVRTHDLLDAIEARSQLRHGPTVTSSYLALQPSRFHRDALAAAPRSNRRYRENSITRFEGTVGTDLKVGHYKGARLGRRPLHL